MASNTSHNSSFSSDFAFNSHLGIFSHCYENRVSNLIFVAFTIIIFLLILPLSVVTLLLGYQQWRRKHSPPTSHSDFFTFHMVLMEMINVLASGGYCVGVYVGHKMLMVVMSHVFYISSCGQMSFHTLTCVERYLAVIFPITYMRVSKGSGVWVRNVVILLVWLLFVALMFSLLSNTVDVIFMVHTVQQAVSLSVIFYCSFAVLRALKRSAPGDRGGDRERVDQLKQKAFNTIMVIMGAVLLSFGGCLIYVVLYASPYISKSDLCVILESSYWFRLPSSVVLPLLFLHRAGKLTCAMYFNSSSNSSLPLNSSLHPVTVTCFNHKLSIISFTAFSITNILLLSPLCVLIIGLGVQQWKKQRSSSTAETSHSDVFTYHLVAMEMFGLFGCGLYCFGLYFMEPWLILVGVYFFTATSNGQIFFHLLTSVERYLAVIHPVLYLNLRQRSGIRIRNITVGCVWLLFLGLFGLTKLSADSSPVPFLCLVLLAIAAISFCSLSVLCALVRPGPGEGAGKRGRADKTKMKAFHTITIILGALLLRFGGQVLVLIIYTFTELSERVRCGLLISGVWFNLPSTLVLPLLFLHRAGKLLCCMKRTE